MLEEHIAKIRESIAQLSELETTLSDLVSRCSGKPIPECAALDAITAAADDVREPFRLSVSVNLNKQRS